MHPRVVDLPPPHHRDEGRAGRHRRSQVAQGGNRVVEEHRPEAGEDVVELLVEGRLLDVANLEAHVVESAGRRLDTRLLDEPRGDVDAERRTGRSNELRELLSRVTEAAADIEHTVAGLGRPDAHRLVPEQGETTDDDVAVLNEAVEENAVPRFLRLEILARYIGHMRSLRGDPPGVADL